MAIGNIPNMQQVNSQAAQLASQWRTIAQQSVAFATYINNLGQAGLVALGFTAADATNLINMADFMLTLAQVFTGTATQASLFNFQNALVAVTGPN